MRARTRIRQWLTRRQPESLQSTTLTRQQIFILPTRAGFMLAVVLLVMLLAALNHNNSLAFIFTFLVGGIALNAMWFTHRQLSGLMLKTLPQNNLFAGQKGEVRILLENPENTNRYSLRLSGNATSEIQFYDCAANNHAIVTLPIQPTKRGRFQYGRFVISTQAPLGLFNAWSWQKLDIRLWVYPKPVPVFPAPLRGKNESGDASFSKSSGDEFDGLREYRPGDPPQRIAWKHQARTDDLLVKEFSQPQTEGLVFSWDALASTDIELKLSQLCYWIVEAERNNQLYGLSLPGIELQSGNGDTHYKQCLLALAQYGFAQ